jgi:hypothetical protein
MSCRIFPGLGTFGEQESWSRRSAGRARAGADKGLFVWILPGAGRAARSDAVKKTRSPPGRALVA